MPEEPRVIWGGSLHSTLSFYDGPAENLKVLLESEGLTPDEILDKLPFRSARSRAVEATRPDGKRYRDLRQVYQTAGLLYEESERVRLTELGRVTSRWLALWNEQNIVVLGRHAAYALAAAQLRNPTRAGQKYAADMEVFPFAFIWRAMLALRGKINSDELNRAIFAVRNERDLENAIADIRHYRMYGGDPDEVLGPETETGENKNDRIIPWMSIASFGWTIINDKSSGPDGEHYTIPSRTLTLIREAARARHKHRDFDSVGEYVEHISAAAALPRDLR